MTKWMEITNNELVDLDKFYKIKLVHSHGQLDFSIIGYLTDGTGIVIQHYTSDQKEQAEKDYANICSFLTM